MDRAASSKTSFADTSFSYCLSSLQHMIESGLGPGCVIGPHGAGKTSLLATLQKQLLASGHWVVLVNEDKLANQQLLPEIASLLGLNATQYQDTQAMLADIASGLARALPAHRMVLLIDDAETLSSYSWSWLTRLVFTGATGNQLLPAVFTTEEPMTEWQWVIQLGLSPLNRQTFDEFLNYLIRQSPGHVVPFSHDAINSLYQYSGGWPGNAEALCQQCWSAATWHQLPEIPASLVESVALSQQPGATPDDAEGDQETGTIQRFQEWLTDNPARARWTLIGSATASALLVVFLVFASMNNQPRLIVAPELMQSSSSSDDIPNDGSTDALELFEDTPDNQGQQVTPTDSSSLPQRSTSQPVTATDSTDPNSESPIQSIPETSKGSDVAARSQPSSAQATAEAVAEKEAPEELTDQSQARAQTEEEPAKLTVQQVAPYPEGNDSRQPVVAREAPRRAGVTKANIRFPVTPESEGTMHVVADHRSLSQMAQIRYGAWNESIRDLVAAANQGLRDIDRLQPGDEVKLPTLNAHVFVTGNRSEGFYFYYGSYGRHTDALKAKRLLIEDGHRVNIIPSRDHRQLWRVFAGPFEYREDAWNALAKIEIGFTPYLFG